MAETAARDDVGGSPVAGPPQPGHPHLHGPLLPAALRRSFRGEAAGQLQTPRGRAAREPQAEADAGHQDRRATTYSSAPDAGDDP